MERRMNIPPKIPEEHMNQLSAALQCITAEKIPQHFLTLLDVFSQYKMDIALMGDSGSGKSSLINALCGLKHDDEGAAPTGVVETSMMPAMYLLPRHPHIRLWDLPGMGTPSFTAKSYIKLMNFHLYDMFFVVISERFRENNMDLINEIQKQNKPFYVVRTKVDNDLRCQSKKSNFNKTVALRSMRDECLKYLHKTDPPPHVFLVSSHETQIYDLQKLKNTLEVELSQLKRQAFPLFLRNFLTGDRKKEMEVKKHTLQSEKIRGNDLRKLCTICKQFTFLKKDESIKLALEAVDAFQLDVVILGETGSGTSTLVKALTGQQNVANASSPTNMVELCPQYPNVRFWALSSVESSSVGEMETIMDQFDFYVIVVSDWDTAQHVELARTVRKLRKQYHFVLTKTDRHLEAYGNLSCAEAKILDGLRAQCAKELQKSSTDDAQLFLINSLDKNAFDFVSLETALSSDLNTIRSSAFAYHTVKIVGQSQERSSCRIL